MFHFVFAKRFNIKITGKYVRSIKLNIKQFCPNFDLKILFVSLLNVIEKKILTTANFSLLESSSLSREFIDIFFMLINKCTVL